MAGVHPVDLAHADAHGGSLVGQEHGVGLDRADGPPGEGQIIHGRLVGGVAGDQTPGGGIVSRGVDQVGRLHQGSPVDLTDDRALTRASFHSQDAQVLLGPQQVQGLGLIARRHYHLGEDRLDLLGHGQGDCAVGGDDPAIGAHGVAGVGAAVGLGDVLPHGQTAGVGVLDHGHCGQVGEVPDRAPGGIRIHIIVVAHFLGPAQVLCRSEAVPVQRVQVEGGLLVGVLAVAQLAGQTPGASQCRGWLLIFGLVLLVVDPCACSPLGDGRVVGGGQGEGFGSQTSALSQAETGAGGDALGGQGIVVRVGDDSHAGMVLGSGPNHGRAANVDALQALVCVGALKDGLLEGVEVDHHQVEGGYAQVFELPDMVGVGHVGQQPGMDVRIQGFDPAVKALGKTGDLFHRGDLDAQILQLLCGAAGGDDLGACLAEGRCQGLKTLLVVDRDQCSVDGSIRGDHGNSYSYA